MHDLDVATISNPNVRLLDLGRLSQYQILDHGLEGLSSSMVKTLKIIYNRLYQPYPRSQSYDELDTAQVIRFLDEKLKIDPQEEIYQELILQITKLRSKDISPAFIERFCLAKISNAILDEYAVNVAEAYVLSYILLNDPTDIGVMYFKLGTSGLLNPTLIAGERIEDIEAIAKFIITSLQEADLLKVSDERWLKPGKAFILMN